jgi:hypothetical protein
VEGWIRAERVESVGSGAAQVSLSTLCAGFDVKTGCVEEVIDGMGSATGWARNRLETCWDNVYGNMLQGRWVGEKELRSLSAKQSQVSP